MAIAPPYTVRPNRLSIEFVLVWFGRLDDEFAVYKEEEESSSVGTFKKSPNKDRPRNPSLARLSGNDGVGKSEVMVAECGGGKDGFGSLEIERVDRRGSIVFCVAASSSALASFWLVGSWFRKFPIKAMPSRTTLGGDGGGGTTSVSMDNNVVVLFVLRRVVVGGAGDAVDAVVVVVLWWMVLLVCNSSAAPLLVP